MIASNHNRRFQFAALHQIIHRQRELRPLAIAKPADARRQSLKTNALPRQIDPAAENAIVRKHLQYQIVSHSDVRRLSRERNPAERPPALAEQRTDVCWNKSREIVSVLHSILEGKGADVIAIIKCD